MKHFCPWPIRLLTLNIRHGGGTRGRALADFIAAQAADLVVLTEHRANATGSALREGMNGCGLRFQAVGSTEPRVNSVCIASRLPFTQIAPPGEGNEGRCAETPAFDASIRSVRYFHQPRLTGITDHSALVVDMHG